MAYIDTKYLGKCETCRHDISGKCDVWCENGEFYSPNLSKIPTADVVEVVRCKDCKRYKLYDKPVEDFDGRCILDGVERDKDFYCGYGERRDT